METSEQGEKLNRMRGCKRTKNKQKEDEEKKKEEIRLKTKSRRLFSRGRNVS